MLPAVSIRPESPGCVRVFKQIAERLVYNWVVVKIMVAFFESLI